MLHLGRILHPTDFSPRAENAFHMACSLARDHGGRVIVLHVAVPPVVGPGGGLLTPPPGVTGRRWNGSCSRSSHRTPGFPSSTVWNEATRPPKFFAWPRNAMRPDRAGLARPHADWRAC